jgi:hypothetical protein
MDIGILINLFPVTFDDCEATLMRADRCRFPTIRDLRQTLQATGLDAHIFAVAGHIYGYGGEQAALTSYGFEPATVRVREMPQLASHLILDGYVASLVDAGYSCRWRFGRATVYQFGTPLLRTSSGVALIRGFEVQSMYLHDPEEEQLVYGLIVDAAFTYRDADDRPISPRDIAARYGAGVLRQLRTRQGDLTPNGGINLEVSRQRLVQYIVPFIAARHAFMLPCGIAATVDRDPVRVVLSGGV